jgi:uncharacterized membrane protein YgcG
MEVLSMKKLFALLLVLLLLAIPVLGSSNLVNDKEGLLSDEEVLLLEQCYTAHAEKCGYTPILLTTPSFDGLNAEAYAADYYDANSYPHDGFLYLVSLTEGEWYILTNGACYDYLPDEEAQRIGDALVTYLRDGEYYEAFVLFTELAQQAMNENKAASPSVNTSSYGKTIAICMGVGLLIGLIAVGIMASMMKSVRSKNSASDYVRSGSMQLKYQRDIFLYSHVMRTPKPKSNSSGSSGGSRGGAGGRI